MTIYIATDIHGRGIKEINDFASKLDLWVYADEVLACHNVNPYRSDSIDTLLGKLYDNGFGTGARSHKRISRKEALTLIRAGGVKNHTLLY